MNQTAITLHFNDQWISRSEAKSTVWLRKPYDIIFVL